MEDVRGRVAVITGANSGIGAACAVAFAGAGMKVALGARRAAELETVKRQCEAVGGEAIAVATDVTKWADCERLVKAATDAWGRLDVLVASAGTNVKNRAYAEVSADDFLKVMDVNVNGLFYSTRAALEPMKRTGGGLMVLISSMASRRQNTVTGPAYTGSKHAVNGIAGVLSAEEQQHNIRVTVISPGVVNTPILDQRPRPPSPEARATLAIQPEDIGEICLLLARLPARSTVPVIDIIPTVFPPQ